MLRYVSAILLFFCFLGLHAQTDEDAVSFNYIQKHSRPMVKSPDPPKPKKHSPKKATLLSLALPGAGQVYNRRNWWWKVPIIYGAGGALLYGALTYNSWYNDFRNAYIFKLQYPDSLNPDTYYRGFQTPTLQLIRDNYRNTRDQYFVWLAVVYAVQVLDAAVEAHFFDFNMNENVSLNVQPVISMYGMNRVSGVQLTLKF